jgi:hypothetical protein
MWLADCKTSALSNARQHRTRDAKQRIKTRTSMIPTMIASIPTPTTKSKIIRILKLKLTPQNSSITQVYVADHWIQIHVDLTRVLWIIELNNDLDQVTFRHLIHWYLKQKPIIEPCQSKLTGLKWMVLRFRRNVAFEMISASSGLNVIFRCLKAVSM